MAYTTKTFTSTLIAIAIIGIPWFLVRGLMAPSTHLEHATVLPSPMDLPDFTLIDQDSVPFTRESLEGNWSLLFFGFTHCPDICPATMQLLATTRTKLDAQNYEESLRCSSRAGYNKDCLDIYIHNLSSLPKIILISVDPERDSPDVLKSYVSHFGKDIMGLTGDMSEIRKLAKQPGIFFQKSSTKNNYSIDHSAAILVINPNAKFHALFSAPHNVDALVHDLPLILAFK